MTRLAPPFVADGGVSGVPATIRFRGVDLPLAVRGHAAGRSQPGDVIAVDLAPHALRPARRVPLQERTLVEGLPRIFNWVIIDTPPLLFSADANLMSTITDGTIMVVRIGATTYDNVIRAMQSLCENNVLGIVANGARASELYSKYTYYYSKAE